MLSLVHLCLIYPLYAIRYAMKLYVLKMKNKTCSAVHPLWRKQNLMTSYTNTHRCFVQCNNNYLFFIPSSASALFGQVERDDSLESVKTLLMHVSRLVTVGAGTQNSGHFAHVGYLWLETRDLLCKYKPSSNVCI